ncbi:MAG: serine/threonine protein kinase [Candidatus Eremiobacteraeota bacterium]|nr:serine/threonine protein kinase [Candidatus Eremiobacteraeota bacterium]
MNHRYEVMRVLGEGATSSVYLVRDKRDVGRLWALKQLTHSTTEIERESLLQEVEFLSTLSHENLVRLVDYFIEDGWDFLVMDRITGPTLQEIIEEAEYPLTEEDAIDYMLQVCRVLIYLHEQEPPIVYRDLKPGNVMVTVYGQVKLIDLGIARHFNPIKIKDTTPLGTPGYCPPEQYGRSQTTPCSDIYSFGATFYHALTLQDPASFNFKFPGTTEINPGITENLSKIINKCLKLKPEERFTASNELYDHLMAHREEFSRSRGNIHFRIRKFMRRYWKNITQLLSTPITIKLD